MRDFKRSLEWRKRRARDDDMSDTYWRDDGSDEYTEVTKRFKDLVALETAINEHSFNPNGAYTLIRRKHGWQVTCARCGGYNVMCSDGSFAIEPLHRILELHSCGEPPF